MCISAFYLPVKEVVFSSKQISVKSLRASNTLEKTEGPGLYLFQTGPRAGTPCLAYGKQLVPGGTCHSIEKADSWLREGD